MASAVTPPRQLAPTVGLAVALAGVSFRTGSVTGSGERVLSGLVCKIGEFNFISDNAGCFANKPFPADGFLMTLGSFVTYVAIEPVREYPAQVLVAEDPPSFRAALGRRSARPGSSVEVMMVGTSAAAGKGDARVGLVYLERIEMKEFTFHHSFSEHLYSQGQVFPSIGVRHWIRLLKFRRN